MLKKILVMVAFALVLGSSAFSQIESDSIVIPPIQVVQKTKKPEKPIPLTPEFANRFGLRTGLVVSKDIAIICDVNRSKLPTSFEVGDSVATEIEHIPLGYFISQGDTAQFFLIKSLSWRTYHKIGVSFSNLPLSPILIFKWNKKLKRYLLERRRIKVGPACFKFSYRGDPKNKGDLPYILFNYRRMVVAPPPVPIQMKN